MNSKIILAACAAVALLPLVHAKEWPGFSRGMGIGGWLTNYKRFNVLPEDRRLPITIGDLEHFDTYVAERDVASIKKMGFDHIRVGFDQIVLEEAPYRYRARTFERLDAFVGWCAKHQINLVLNLHKAVGNYCDIKEKVELLDDAELQNRFIALWLEIERRYHDRPGIAFELLNEVRDVDPEKWNRLADRALKALRATNPTRWIVIGSTCWNSPHTLAKLRIWDDPHVVYTFHMYAPFCFTHQRGVLQASPLYYNRAMEYPSKDVERYREYDRLVNGATQDGYAGVTEIGRQTLRNEMHGAHEFVKRHPDKILWNGEFGTIRHAPPASRVAYMRDVVGICKEWGIPYSVWNYLSTPNDGNRFSLVDDDTRQFLSSDLLAACLGELEEGVWHELDGAPHLWTRDENAGTLVAAAPRTWLVMSRGERDLAFCGFKPFSATPSGTYAFEAHAELPCGVETTLPVSLSCIARDAAGNVLHWCWAQRELVPGKTVRTTFMAPPGAATLEPRFVGFGQTSIVISNPRFFVGKELPAASDSAEVLKVDSDALAFTFATSNGAITVTDRRTGRTWRSQPQDNAQEAMFVQSVEKLPDGCFARFVDRRTRRTFDATFRLDRDEPALLVSLEGEGPYAGGLDYPAPFATEPGDRLVYPQNEGVSFPVEERHPVASRLAAYCGSELCMAFFGVTQAKSGAGWMTILETPDDAAMQTRRDASGCVSAGPAWDSQLGSFGPTRRARYVFFDKGGHVAMCKRYRAYAQSKGLWRPFADKLKSRPVLDRLFGAVNIWCWEPGKTNWVRRLQEAGIRRILWSGGGSPEEVSALAANPEVLVGRYDIYTDVYHPEQLKKLGWKSGCNTEAWPNDVIWSRPDPSAWTRAWGVQAKDGSWTYCATLCDMVSPAYCRRNIANELKTTPYNTRFLDVTTASDLKECWNPQHPMSRTQSREARQRLLNVLSGEFGLVTGSETGHDFSVPTCDYYEGMLSLCPYRVPDSGRNIQQVWTNAPERVAKYQVGERTRVPLWELVYHDCTCAQWYWGDYNNKLPQLWAKRDLFNVLYGTMGMFMLSNAQWTNDRDRFVRSYRITSPVARATATSEMTDHRVLKDDWSVQRTVFANGVTVTVNFGESPWTDADGAIVAPRSHRVVGLKEAK